MMVASTIGTLVIAAASTFMIMASRSTLGIVKQSTLNNEASHAGQFVFTRIRTATSTSVRANGDILVLAFDNDHTVDSDNDDTTYNDKDRFEAFRYTNGDGDDATTADNRLIFYDGDTNSSISKVLIESGVTKLPGESIFTINTNSAAVFVSFGLKDGYARDGDQQVDIRTRYVPRNRLAHENTITILP